MQSEEIRRRFLDFFEKRGHKVIPSASLVPVNDSSVLFTTAGMQPLVPYLLGRKHPQGRRLVNVQKCVRTQDIDEVGDKTHDTFFEMLGNWSLGDYFKEEAIKWSYELLTSQSEGFGLERKRLYVTVFEGDENAPRDMESFEIWKKIGIPENRIYFMPADKNWWSVGADGPCGPDTEMFYDITAAGLGDLNREEYIAADGRQEVVEIWNDVFMEYEKKNGRVIGKLKQKNVDTGSGLERLATAVQKKDNLFETDLFSSLIAGIRELAERPDVKAERIIADHLRTAIFIIADGVMPSNTDRGYILRRLIRRAVRYTDMLGIKPAHYVELMKIISRQYRTAYPNVFENLPAIQEIYMAEAAKFEKTLSLGLKQFDKGVDPFVLFTSYGFPIELTEEIAKEKGMTVDKSKFQREMDQHKQVSSAAGERKFKK